MSGPESWMQEVPLVRLPYAHDFPAPVPAAFAWLTDFDEGDPKRAGAITKSRRVLERSPSRVVMRNRNEALGVTVEGTGTVDLHPPDRWQVKVVDDRGRLRLAAMYRLEPRGASGSRLHIEYFFAAPKLKHKIRFLVGRPLIRREIGRMWKGYEAAMRRELPPARSGAPG